MSTVTQSNFTRKVSFQKLLEQTDEEQKAETNLKSSLPRYSSSPFNADAWVLDKKSRKAHSDRIAFREFKPMGKNGVHLVKLFATVILNRGASKSLVDNLHKYFVFLVEGNISLLQIDKKTLGYYSHWIDQQTKSNKEPLSEPYKHALLNSALKFHAFMNGHSYISYIEGIEAIVNPYNKKAFQSKYKVIDDNTLKILDKHFHSDEAPLHFRVAFWIMRLYGTRPEDTVNYPLDCVRTISDDMGTIKQAIVKNSKSDTGIDYNIEFLNLNESMQKNVI